MEAIKKLDEMTWGILPAAASALLLELEWNNSRHLRRRLLGERPFPIEFSLKVPTGREILTNLNYFSEWVRAWSEWPNQQQIRWGERTFQQVGKQRLPEALLLANMQELIEFLGESAIRRSQHWNELLKQLLSENSDFYSCFVRNLSLFEQCSEDEMRDLLNGLRQLKPKMGQDLYLREIPLIGLDTKFIESYELYLEALLNVQYPGAITEAGSLQHWLGVKDIPADWLTVRPLCEESQRALGGLPLFQLSTDDLINTPLPCERIIVVENKQSGYALPSLPHTIAISGGGNNTRWLSAPWLEKRILGYWGDIDSWGFKCLADVRAHQPHVTSLLMDVVTLQAHSERIVYEPESTLLPFNLTVSEVKTFNLLKSGELDGNRLEQERLSSDYIHCKLREWYSSD